jgi:hypothetical protein
MDATGEDEAVVTVWRYSLRVGVVVTCLTGVGVGLAAPAGAAVGFTTRLSGLPDEFTAGDQVRTLSAVVSRDGGGCVKVRWSMVLSVQGIRLDQVKMDRVEESGSFPLEIQTDGDVARLTDRELDPGTLCPDRTVTARYRLAFAEDVTQGQVTLAAEAYDAGLNLLSRQTATRTVVGAGGEATPTEAPDPTESAAEPTVEPTEESTDDADPGTDPSGEAVAELPPTAGRPVAQSGGFGAVQAAFLLGGLLLTLGVGLLVRLRHLLRPAAGGRDVGGRPVEWSTAPRRWRPARR